MSNLLNHKEEILVSDILVDNESRLWAFDKIRQAIVLFNENFMSFEYVRGLIADGIIDFINVVESYIFKDIIWFSDLNKPNVYKYDIKSNRFFCIKNELYSQEETSGMYDIIRHEDRLLILSRSFSDKSYVFSTASETFSEISFLDEKLETCSGYSFFYQDKDNLYLVASGKNMILKYKLDDVVSGITSYEVITVAPEIKGVCAYFRDGKVYISSHGDSAIHVFDKNGNHTVIEGYEDDTYDKDYYCRIMEVDGFLVALPRHGRKVLIHDYDSKKTHYVQLPFENDEEKTKKVGSLCHECYYSERESALYLFPWEYKHISQIDLTSFEIKVYDPEMKEEGYYKRKSEFIKYIEETQGRHEMWIEGNDDIELNEYIKLVADEVLM